MTFRPISVVIIFLVALPGCGGDGDTASVSGKVSFEGKPMAGASVAFHPAGKGKICTGTTVADGTFNLQLSGSEKSERIPIGQYNVTVTAIESNDGGGDGQDPTGSLVMMSRKPPKPPRSLLPQKFANPKTSGLTFEVKAGEDNVANLDLKP